MNKITKITKIRTFDGIQQHHKEYMMEHYYQYSFYFDSMINNDIHLVIRL